jgi:hypothetical protein
VGRCTAAEEGGAEAEGAGDRARLGLPAQWKRPVSARDERTLWLVVFAVAVMLSALAWWQGRSLLFVAIHPA